MSSLSTSKALNRILSSITPASGAVVMGTGIVSVALASDGRATLSVPLLAISATIWGLLGVMLIKRALGDWPRTSREARLPSALTGVAATAVLGARVSALGWDGLATALLAIASVLWCILFPLAMSQPPARTEGVGFMPAVSTQSLAVLAAQLAVPMHAPWLLDAGLALLGLGLALYVFVLARFDFSQLLVGRGDQWVGGGALAISALAAARITLGARGLHQWGPAAGSFQMLTLALWAVSVAWLPVLILTETLRVRLGYDVRRWATVFPVGMYAACSFDAGHAAQVSGLNVFARVWVWLAFALWLLVFVAMLWHSRVTSGARAQ